MGLVQKMVCSCIVTQNLSLSLAVGWARIVKFFKNDKAIFTKTL